MFHFQGSHLRYLALFILVLVAVVGFGSAANVTFSAPAQNEIGYGDDNIEDFTVAEVDYTLDAADPRQNPMVTLTFNENANEVRIALEDTPATWTACTGTADPKVWECNTPVQVVDMTQLHVVATYDSAP